MKTRIIHTKIWDDDWFQSLNPNSQRLLLYLLTCQDVNICGIFELSDRKIEFHTRLSDERLQEAKKGLAPKILFYNGWIYIKNVDKYNSYKGLRNDSARVNELLKVPTEVIEYIRGIDTSMDTSIYTALNTNTNLNHNLNTNDEKVSKEFLDNVRKQITEKLKVSK